MRKLRSKLTYANVTATVALFLVVAGGSAFAASQVTKNSIGPNQLKKNAVTAAKIKNGAVTPAKLNSAAKATLVGPQGPRGERGAQGERGPQGEPGPFPATLPSGKTIVGVYDITGTGAANTFATGDISYLYLAPGQQVIYVKLGTTDKTCTGNINNPTAPSSVTCVYEAGAVNVLEARGLNASYDSGVALYIQADKAGEFLAYGVWAATGG